MDLPPDPRPEGPGVDTDAGVPARPGARRVTAHRGGRAALGRLAGRRWRGPVLTGLVALGLGLWLTRHVWAAPGSTRIAGNPHDIDLYTWWLQHTASSLVHGRDPILTHALNAPSGVNATWNTSVLLPGLLMAPVTLLGGPLLAYNLLALGSFGLTAAFAQLLFRRFVTHGGAAVVGALTWTFSTSVLAGELGHLSFVLDPLVPLMLLQVDAVVRAGAPTTAAQKRSRRVQGQRLGVLCAAQLLTGEEILFQTGIFVLLVLVALAAHQPQAWLAAARRLVPAATWAVATLLALGSIPLLVQLFGPLHQHGTPFLVGSYGSDPRALVTPSNRLAISTAEQAAFARTSFTGPTEYGSYLGLPLVGAVLLVRFLLRRDALVRALFAAGVVLAVAALGTHLVLNGRDTGVTMPWKLFSSLPLLEAAVPSRFALFTALAAAALVTLGLDRLGSARAAWQIVAGPLVALCVVTALPASYPAERAAPIPALFTDPAAVRGLAGRTVLVLPYPSFDHTEPMRWQAATGMAFDMVGGYFIGPDGNGQAFFSGAAPLPSGRSLQQTERDGIVPEATDETRAQFAEDLRTWGASVVLVGPVDNQDALVRAVTGQLGFGPVWDADVATFRIGR